MLKDLFRRRFFTVTIFGAALSILIILGLISISSTQSWIRNRTSVIQTRDAILTYEKLLSFLKDAEASQRAYLLIGDSTYLEPYHIALDSVDQVLARINDFAIGEDSIRGKGIAAINALVNERLESLRVAINLRNQEGLEAAINWIRQNRGKTLMDRLRREIIELQDNETRVLERQTALLSSSTSALYTAELVGSLISIILLIWAFMHIWRQMDQRQKDLSKLEDYSQNLEQKVQERTEELQASMKELNANNEELNAMVSKLTAIQQELIEQQYETQKALGMVEREHERKSKELEEARNLQISMLPQKPPALENMDIAMFMQTCTEVGGDYYDYKIDDDGTLTIVIGYATGHGMKAGILVATVKSYFQTLANQQTAVEMLQQISEGIKNLQIRAMYMGLTVVKIKDNELTIASSGMPPAYLYRQARREVEPILLKGVFLGSNLQIPYRLTSIKLHPGDTLLLMSDGLPELFNSNREMLDYHRVEHHYRQIAHLPAEQVIQELLALGKAWANGNENEDDITMIVVKVK